MVNLTRATITGQVDCTDGTFDGQGGTALNAGAITIGADLFLCEGFTAKGTVNLTRATITGNLSCHDGTFDGGMDCEGARIGAGLFFTKVKAFSGPLDLTDTEVGRLQDDPGSYNGADPLILNGFRYDRLTGDMTIQQRLDWLAGKAEKRIEPAFEEEVTIHGESLKTPAPLSSLALMKNNAIHSPYTQLAKVLREQGVAQGAARILEERDRRVVLASYHRALASVDGTWRAGWEAQRAILKRPFDRLFGLIFGYGHLPGRAVLWVLMIIGLNWALYAHIWECGQMAPTSDVVLTSAAWTEAVLDFETGISETPPQNAWADNAEAAKDYTTFSPALYALDLFIPLDALGQEAAWAPSPVRGWLGWIGFWTGWLTQLSGWVITAIGAAAVAGLVGRKE